MNLDIMTINNKYNNFDSFQPKSAEVFKASKVHRYNNTKRAILEPHFGPLWLNNFNKAVQYWFSPLNLSINIFCLAAGIEYIPPSKCLLPVLGKASFHYSFILYRTKLIDIRLTTIFNTFYPCCHTMYNYWDPVFDIYRTKLIDILLAILFN